MKAEEVTKDWGMRIKPWIVAAILFPGLLACGNRKGASESGSGPVQHSPVKSMDGRYSLMLIKQIPKSALKRRPPFPNGEARETDEEGGFLRGGMTYCTGQHGWAYHLDKNQMEQLFPDGRIVSIAPDGQGLIVMIKGQQDEKESYYWKNSSAGTNKIETSDECIYNYIKIHPGNACFMAYSKKPYNKLPHLTVPTSIIFWSMDGKYKWEIKRNKSWDIDDSYILGIKGFTMDGKYALGTFTPRLLDIREKQLLPLDPGSDITKTTSNNLISSDVYSRDASWVAGFSDHDDNDGKTIASYLWDRISRKFVWKGKQFGTPVCFSANDAYLLVNSGSIIRTKSGEPVFQGLKGKSGRFSPDGLSLVTMDDEAFYIYTLPKDSEPIFGVFQKPEPWSPPKAKVKVKVKTR